MKKQFQLLLILFFVSFLSTAQETGSIEGKIISKDGFPLSGVSIKLGKKISVSKTDANGLFHFENFPVGLHTITIEAEGLKKQTQDIKVITNETTKVTFTYGRDKSLTSGQTTVTLPQSPITGDAVVNV
jgi:iron complex outermembrane receptor protein